MEWGHYSLGEQGVLDEDVANLLAKAAELNLPSLGSLGAVEARAEFARRLAHTNPPPPEGIDAKDVTIPGPGGEIPLRLYRPNDGPPAGALVYYHGGGFVVGSIDTHDSICRHITKSTGTLVISVEYRMGPEHPYPAAVEDAASALVWATGLVPNLPLGVGGDSAGGTLAAVMAQHARDLGIALAGQLLIYPAVDQLGDYPSRARLAEGHLLTQADIEWFTSQYFVGRQGPVLEPDASPIRAASLEGLAPALVLTCGFDPLVDEGQAYAKALDAAGVKVLSVCLEGAIHGCLGLGGYLECGKAALEQVSIAWSHMVY
jgi:acetyl esterase